MTRMEGISRTAAKKKARLRRDLIQQLLTQCTSITPLTDSDLENILSLINQVIDAEKGISNIQLPDRTSENAFPALLRFCEDNGVDTSKVSVASIDDSRKEFGLVATENILENELILSIPRSLVMTCEHVPTSSLGFLKDDPLLTEMPNLLLVMCLIHELCLNEKSFWKPYIDCLPSSYYTPLYMEWNSIQLLKPSSSFQEAGKLIRNIGRQYAYFWTKMNKTSGNNSSLPTFAPFFTFDIYRWAVSTVMTRQNVIPSSSSKTGPTETEEKKLHALIPLWDLCNHSPHPPKFSTDFSLEQNCVLCFATKSFAPGSEVTIFYGNRSYEEYFIHNGFIPEMSDGSFLHVTLGISKNDPLEGGKRSLCCRLGISSSGKFKLFPRKENLQGDDGAHSYSLVDPHLLAFLRVFNMKEDQLISWSNRDDTTPLLTSPFGSFTPLDDVASRFLSVRASLLVKSYPSDEMMKGWTTDTEPIKQLLRAEKEILLTHL